MIYKQFNNSPNIIKFIKMLEYSVNVSHDIETFINDYLNLETAKGYGLDTLGAKIGINRTISSIIFDDQNKIGFKGQNLGNFFESNFAKLSKNGVYVMGDDQYRRVLRMGLLSISTPCTIPGLNLFYKTFYPRTVIVEFLMAVEVTFYDMINIIEGIILRRRDLIPIPLGVSLDYIFNNNTKNL